MDDAALCRTHDVGLFDLDGVIYRGAQPVPHAPESVAAAREAGLQVAFVTNNASRPPSAVAEHLAEGGVPAEESDVVTSAQAAARVLRERYGAGAHVLALGAQGLLEALAAEELVAVGVEDEAVAAVGAVIDEIDPDVVVTYDAHGGYAHPDHIRTHEVTRAAVAARPEGSRPALFGVFTPRSWALEDREVLATLHAHAQHGWTQPTGELPPSVVDDAVVTHAIVDEVAVDRQEAALRHHRTQVTLGPSRTYALSNDIAARLPGREGFARLDLTTGQPVPAVVVGERPPLVARR